MSLVTRSSYTTNPTAQLSADDVLEVRSFYTRSFIAADGVTPVVGNDSNGQSGPYYSLTPTLVNGNLVVPALDIQPTTESNPTGNYIEQLWVNEAYSQTLMPNNNVGTGWQIPTVYGSVIAFDEIATYNRAKQLTYPPQTYFTADETVAEIRRLAGDFMYAAVGVNGIGSTSVAPTDPSLPILVEDNDPRNTNTRVPTDGSVTPAKFASSAIDPAVNVAGARTLGTGAQQSAAGNDSRFPTADQKAALVGTSGTPSASNEYVTNADLRLPVAPPTLFVDRYAGADFGAQLTAAIADLPSSGGIIDARMITGAQTFSSNLTINKSNTVILFGNVQVSMGTNRIIISTGLKSVGLYGQGPWGSGNNGDLQGTVFSYSGTDYALTVGDNTTQTWFTEIKNINILCTGNSSAGIHLLSTLFAKVEHCRIKAPNGNPGPSTANGITVAGGTAPNDSNYAAYNVLADNFVSNFKYGIVFGGLSAFSCNDNQIIRGLVTLALQSGGIGVDIELGDTNTITQLDITNVETGVRVINGARWNGGESIRFENVTTLFNIESGATDNKFHYFNINNAGAVTNSGLRNTLWDASRAQFLTDANGGVMQLGDATSWRLKTGIGSSSLVYLQPSATDALHFNDSDGLRKIGIFTNGITLDGGPNGAVVINENNSAGALFKVVGIPVFANNAAAIAGGLVPGNVYRSGGDPDVLSVVH